MTFSGWFKPGAVRCSLNNPNINLGIFSRIDPAYPPRTQGNFNVSCESNAYPNGYPDTQHTVEGGYCMTIKGPRELKGLDENNKGLGIPFDFYNDTHKKFDQNRPQNFTTPIGDGTYGIGFFDWDYRDGPENCGGKDVPKTCGDYLPIPVKALVEVRISPAAASRAWPIGKYRGTFDFSWVAGEVRTAGTYPKVTGGPDICDNWTGTHGGGKATIEVTVKKYCFVKTTQHIDFGKQVFLDNPIPATGEFEVICSEGTQYGVGINYGLNSNAKQRAMKCAEPAKCKEELIEYNLYQEGRKPWYDIGDKPNLYKDTGMAKPKQVKVYAEVPLQGAKPKPFGKYSDTVVISTIILDPGPS